MAHSNSPPERSSELSPDRSPDRAEEPRARHSARRIGFTREAQLLLPAGLLLLVVLSTFTLFSYRNAIDLLTQERRLEASRAARRVAQEVSSSSSPAAAPFARLAPGAVAVTVVDAKGRAIAASGMTLSNALLPVAEGLPSQAVALGPGPELPDTVAAFAPARFRGETVYVRVDLPAAVLAAKHRSLPVLTTLVLGVNLALTLLLLSFLRRLLAPYRTLLQRAREVGGAEEGGDETAFLLSTFERAVTALERSAAPSDSAVGDPAEPEAIDNRDIAALERMLSASLDSGLLLLDRRGGVLAINPPGAEILAVAAPPTRTPVEELLSGRPDLLAILQRSLETRRGVRRREIGLELHDGRITLGLSVHPLRRQDGFVRGFLVLFTDLTEAQREAEESRLAEGVARLGEMAAGVAHELRNSLATLRGYLGLLERRCHEESWTRETVDDLGEMRRETDQLQRVVDDFLAFARPETTRIEELRLATVVRRAAADPVLGGVRVEIAPGEASDATIRGDAQLLERAVRNLLRNAMEAECSTSQVAGSGPAGPPRIRVSLHRSENEVEVTIEDRGPGLPEEVRHRLFQPFASGRPGGVGLGLALSQRIAGLHGGRIRVEDREGGGTRVRLLLPTPSSDSITDPTSESATESGVS